MGSWTSAGECSTRMVFMWSPSVSSPTVWPVRWSGYNDRSPHARSRLHLRYLGPRGPGGPLEGWLYQKRSSGKLHFLQVRDGTGVIQCVVFKGEVPEEVFERASRVTQESSVFIRGTVRADDRSSIGYELGVNSLEINQLAQDYPITPKEHGTAFLMDHRHLWLRSSRQHAIIRVRSEIIQACRDYLNGMGFVLVDAPIFTPAACEGTTTLFETDYFDDKAFLTQSGQLYMEAAAMAFGKVYCFGPTFRAGEIEDTAASHGILDDRT